MILAKLIYPERGYQSDQDLIKELEVGAEYELENVNMGQSNTTIFLKGFKNGFNSVHFIFLENGKPLDIFADSRFNPYMKIVYNNTFIKN